MEAKHEAGQDYTETQKRGAGDETAAGQRHSATQQISARRPKPTRRGQTTGEAHADPARRKTNKVGQITSETQLSDSDPNPEATGRASGGLHPIAAVPALVAQLNALHRKRQYYIGQRIAIRNRLESYVRRLVGYNSFADEESREKTKAIAQKICAGKTPEGYEEYAKVAMPEMVKTEQACDVFAPEEAAVNKAIAKLVRQLPVWPWVETVRGVSESSIGTIVGEAGDLSNYANPGKLWKRFGLAPYDGYAASSWRSKRAERSLSAEEWTAIGYVPRRRSVVYVIEECFVKLGGDYREVYDQRKEYEAPRVKTKIHAHKRAMRYAGKRFLRDLWINWNKATKGEAGADSQSKVSVPVLVAV